MSRLAAFEAGVRTGVSHATVRVDPRGCILAPLVLVPTIAPLVTLAVTALVVPVKIATSPPHITLEAQQPRGL